MGFSNESTIEKNIMAQSGEPLPFPHLADGFRFPRLGETIDVKISAIESADISFEQ